jgi:hypothetical protein
MRPLSFPLRWLCGLFGAALALGAGSPSWPGIVGEIHGRLESLPAAPALQWSLTMMPGENGLPELAVRAAGEGTLMEAGIGLLPAAPDALRWRLKNVELDLARWSGALAAQWPALAGATLGGRVLVSGEGEWREGRLTGRIKLEWHDGTVHDAAQGWSLDGIAFQGALVVDSAGPRLASESPFELTVGTVTSTRFGARDVVVRASLNEHWQVAVTTAHVAVAGGEVAIDPCALSLWPPKMDVNLRIAGVGLQDVVALVPAGLADARGRIDGAVRVSWSQAGGFQVGAGGLALNAGEPAMLRLAESPGFLTRRVPARFALLPDWMGPLARWFAPENPAYAELREIELGHTDLQVKALIVRLTPAGDGQGRSALVQMIARPSKSDSAVARVTFEVAVAGPLDAVLHFGLNQDVSVQMR